MRKGGNLWCKFIIVTRVLPFTVLVIFSFGCLILSAYVNEQCKKLDLYDKPVRNWYLNKISFSELKELKSQYKNNFSISRVLKRIVQLKRALIAIQILGFGLFFLFIKLRLIK